MSEIGIKDQCFGVEVEMTGITREQAAHALADYFGTSPQYGNVSGDVRLTGSTVIISGEEIYNDTLDTLVISGQNRSVIRHPARDELAPQIPEPQQEKKQRKEVER